MKFGLRRVVNHNKVTTQEMNTWASVVQKGVALESKELNEERNKNIELIREIMEDLHDEKTITVNNRSGSNDILVNENGQKDGKGEKKFYRKRTVPRKKNKNYATKPKIDDSALFIS